MHFIDDWYDFGRVAVCLLSMWCFVTLIRRYMKFQSVWTSKTKDYWYSMLMWSLVGMAVPIQGILFDLPLNPAIVIVTAAVLVTGKGLHAKGSWGGSDT